MSTGGGGGEGGGTLNSPDMQAKYSKLAAEYAKVINLIINYLTSQSQPLYLDILCVWDLRYERQWES
jgi:hypothetical protein